MKLVKNTRSKPFSRLLSGKAQDLLTNLPAVVSALTTLPRVSRAGKVRPMILLWALGVPIPIILIIVLIRGCM